MKEKVMRGRPASVLIAAAAGVVARVMGAAPSFPAICSCVCGYPWTLLLFPFLIFGLNAEERREEKRIKEANNRKIEIFHFYAIRLNQYSRHMSFQREPRSPLCMLLFPLCRRMSMLCSFCEREQGMRRVCVSYVGCELLWDFCSYLQPCCI